MIILGTNSIKDTGFSVDNSARFDGSSYLHRTPSATGNPKKWTYSVWVKMAQENPGYFLSAGSGTQSKFIFGAYGGGDIDILTYEGYVILANTARKFRDPSAWYNIILAVDTTQSSYVNGLKLWVNGELQSLTLSSVGSENGYTQNTSLRVGTNNEPIHIGRDINDSGHWKGYMAECALVNDAQLDADQFGEFDEDSGIWKPIDVSGLTFGTNGFYLDFENSGALGADVSGNTNNFTVNNLTAIDQSTDTCTNNFATLNPLASGSFPVFSEGNINVRANSDAEYGNVFSTLSTSSSGKWYYEIKVISKTGTSPWLGLVVDDAPKAGIATNGGANSAGGTSFSAPSFAFQSNGKVSQGGSEGSTYTSFATGDIISFSIDMDNGACYIAKNGTYMNSGNPASGSSKTGAIVTWTASSISGFLPSFSVYGAASSTGNWSEISMNFGSPAFAISSGNTDGNGYGNFEYAVPSGYYALNTKNLAEYG